MTRYAQNTKVSSDRSLSEIQRTLERYGAEQFGYGQDTARGIAFVQFCAHERHIRFVLTMPDRTSKEFTKTPTGKLRDANAAHKEWEQACKQRWRALVLSIKAKLEAVESGIAEFESEFLSYIVLPGDRFTVGQVLRPQIEQAYLEGSSRIQGVAGFLPAPEKEEEVDYEQ